MRNVKISEARRSRFGMNFVEAMDEEAFIPRHVTAEMRTVFPSTTPTALTSLATGKWPSQHAITGWHTFLPEVDDVTTIIRFQRASDEKPLSELGVVAGAAYPTPSKLSQISRESLFLMPEEIEGTAYSQYWNGDQKAQGYNELPQAFDVVAKGVAKATAPSFTYLYIPHVDSAAHKCGANHKETWARVSEVNKLMEALAASLPADARLVMTADHGHLDAEKDFSHTIPSLPTASTGMGTRKHKVTTSCLKPLMWSPRELPRRLRRASLIFTFLTWTVPPTSVAQTIRRHGQESQR